MVSILILLDYQFYQSPINFISWSNNKVSILILLDYQFYQFFIKYFDKKGRMFQSLFYWIINSIEVMELLRQMESQSFNPYSTGLSILSCS